MATFCHGGFGIGAERSATTGGDLRRLRSSGYGIFSMLTRRGILLCETSLLYCPRLIQCAGYDSFGVRLWDLFMNGANRSIGTARMVVVLCSLEISFIVCKDAQLQGNRLRGNHRCRLHEFFRGLKLAFGVYVFCAALPLRLGLAGHRAFHAVGQNNFSDLYSRASKRTRINQTISVADSLNMDAFSSFQFQF